MTKKILGVIPARAGSKGVPGKNLMMLGGVSLVGHAVRCAAKSRLLTRAIVSTEDSAIAEDARRHGAEVPFTRPGELATDTAGVWDVARHAVRWLEENESWPADIVVVLQPTTPFRAPEHIDECIARMIEADAPVCITVRRVDYPPEWMFRRSEDGRLDRYVEERPWPSRRQDAKQAWQPNGMVYVLNREALSRNPPIPVEGMLSIEVEKAISINIDDPDHAWLAERLWTERGQE